MSLYLIEFVLVIILILLLARVLGANGFGGFVFLLTVFLFVSVLNIIGLNSILFHEMSTRPHARESIFRNGLALKLLTGIVAVFIAAVVAIIAPLTDLPYWVAIIAATMLFTSTSLASVALILCLPCQIDSREKILSLMRKSKRALQFLAVCVGVVIAYHGVPSVGNLLPLFVPLGLPTILIIFAAGEILEMGVLVYINYKHGVSLLPRWDANTIRFLLRQAKPLAMISGLMIILFRANILILSLYLPVDEIGLFALPMFLAEFALILPILYATSVSKTFKVVHRNQPREFLRLSRLSFHLMALIAAPIICIVWMFSRDIMTTLAGQLYTSSAQILVIFFWNLLLLFGGVLFGVFLMETGEKKVLGAILGWGALFNIILNFSVIPSFGIVGAAWVSFISTIIILIVSLLHQNARELARIWVISLPTPIAGIMIVNLFARGLSLDFFPATIFTVLFFSALVVLTRYFTQEDLQQVIRLLKH